MKMLPGVSALSTTAALAIFLELAFAFVGPVAHAQSYLYNQAAFPAGGSPAAVVVGDFNRDGRLDLAVTNYSDNTVSILLGIRGGTFAPKVDYVTGMQPTALVATDFNNDGKMDLASVNLGTNTISVLLGNGDGTFQGHTDYLVGNVPRGIVAADFNNDHNVDLAIVNQNDSTVSVLLGNGDGTFQPQSVLSVCFGAGALALGDFNGDGKVDLIATSSTVTVLLSKGDGSFTRVDSESASNSSGVTVGDFNGDGELDAVVSTQVSQQFYILLGNGDGTFRPPKLIPNTPFTTVFSLLSGDFNHDGKLDLVLGNAFVLLGNGNGTFNAAIACPFGAYSLTSADLNGDGELDLVGADQNFDSVDVLIGKGDGSFGGMTIVNLAPQAYFPDGAAAADFNGDGKLDLAVTETNIPNNGKVLVELGRGNGTFQKPLISALSTQGDNAGAVVAADFNNDGKMDLAVVDTYLMGFEILLGNGDGTFRTPVDNLLNYTISSFAIGDFNRDGKADVVVISNEGFPGSLNIYLGKGDGTFSAGAQYTLTGSYVIVDDVNLDGKLDLIATGFGSPIEIFLGNGDGTFQSAISGPSDLYTSKPVAGDFNGDGKIDLAVGIYLGVAFLAGNGDGSFQGPVYSTAASQFYQMVAGDFNGDGKLDLFVGSMMLGNGDGTFQWPTTYGATGAAVAWLVGDFNSDGVSDLAIPNQSFSNNDSVVSLYLSSPTISLFPSSLHFAPEHVGQVSASKNVALSNLGNAALKISSITATGDFIQKNNCSTRLAIGKTCTIHVAFKPTAKGERTGTVSVHDNAYANPQTIRLKGTGE